MASCTNHGFASQQTPNPYIYIEKQVATPVSIGTSLAILCTPRTVTELEVTVDLMTSLLVFLGMGFVMLFLMFLFVKACERV